METFSVELSEIGDGVYETQLPSLPPGKFSISAEATFMDKNIGTTKTSLVVEEYQLEFAQINQDVITLKAVSEASGGKYFSENSMSELPNLLNMGNRLRTWTTEKELWNSIWLLLLIIASLATEWFLRKRINLL